MKLLILLLFFVICSADSTAQYNTSISSIADSQYVVKKTGASNFFFVHNKENHLKELTSEDSHTLPDFIDFSSATMQLRSITKSVLGESFGQSKRDMLVVFFCINNEGRILEVEYGVNSPTAIPLSKLASLESLLKEKLVFIATNDSLSKRSLIRFGMTASAIRLKK